MHPSSPADEIGGTENGNFEDLAGRVQPEVGALGKSRAKLCGFAFCGVPQLNEGVLRTEGILLHLYGSADACPILLWPDFCSRYADGRLDAFQLRGCAQQGIGVLPYDF